MNYTVIGDSVNMASRLQGVNKFYQTSILIGKGTLTEAGDRIVARWIDRVRVSGRDEAEDVFELLALKSTATDRLLELAAHHETARLAYSERDWDRAENELRQVMAYNPHDGPASILIARLYEFRQRPPGPDWDGSQPMTSK